MAWPSPLANLGVTLYPPLGMWARYALSPMKELWTLERQYALWLRVELAALEALEELNKVPAGVAERIRARAQVDPERIRALEREVGHDLVAFLWSLEEQAGPEGRWLHYGLTSSDVKDTALALLWTEALDVLLLKVDRLNTVLKERAWEHKNTVMMGRTHGQWAEPTTFGLKLLGWWEEGQRVRQRLMRARETVAVGKLSGAVGTHAYFPPEAEARALRKLGLQPCPVATQVIPRDRHAEVFFALGSCASWIEKMALEVRHLSRSEVGEVEEGEPEGSSAMPHKRNPILSERLSGLSRVVRAALGPAWENNALWHERDMSHSSVERLLGPQTFVLVDYMLDRAARLIRGLRVLAERMEARIREAKGLPFSEGLLLALVQAGMGRRAAHALVGLLAERARAERRELEELALEDPVVRSYLSPAKVRTVFSLEPVLAQVDAIFAKVWGEGVGYNGDGHV